MACTLDSLQWGAQAHTTKMPSVCQSRLLSPDEVERRLPLEGVAAHTVLAGRAGAGRILRREERRLALLLGPCSVHCTEEALEYAGKLRALQSQLNSFFLIMRVFVEKPRTRLGWKGMLYDPYLDGSNDLQEGIVRARKLLLDVNALGVPCAAEFLDPLAAPYIADLITWGLIGARTSASQPHRQLASGLPFPVGFKNSVHGELETAISGIVSAKMPHAHLCIDGSGQIAAAQTTGNPLAHLVLRGSTKGPNYDALSVQNALQALREHHVEERLVIDCAHGNSGKDPTRQCAVFEIAIHHEGVVALMLESHLSAGKQPLPEEPEQLRYGISITDACLGWEETAELILAADARLSTEICSVQK